KSCTDSTRLKPVLCPPGATDSPDISLSGSFLAGGDTNPIYSLELKGGYIFQNSFSRFDFYPGVTGQLEINQDSKPPNKRTRFDPDSITAGFALTNVINLEVGPIAGMRLQVQVPEGEFSRS